MIATFENHRIDVYATTEGRDASGGLTITQGPEVATGVLARVQDATVDQVMLYGFREIDATHLIFAELPGIQNGYEVVWNSKLLRVTGVSYRRGCGTIRDFYVVAAVEVDRQL